MYLPNVAGQIIPVRPELSAACVCVCRTERRGSPAQLAWHACVIIYAVAHICVDELYARVYVCVCGAQCVHTRDRKLITGKSEEGRGTHTYDGFDLCVLWIIYWTAFHTIEMLIENPVLAYRNFRSRRRRFLQRFVSQLIVGSMFST